MVNKMQKLKLKKHQDLKIINKVLSQFSTFEHISM
jgi:hypothetical protein